MGGRAARKPSRLTAGLASRPDNPLRAKDVDIRPCRDIAWPPMEPCLRRASQNPKYRPRQTDRA